MAGGTGRSGPQLALVGQEKDLAFYAREAVARGGPVLVLGAGTGRIAWELALRGVRTVAVEPSLAMLEVAQERRAQEPAEASDRLSLLNEDPRSLRLSQRFPLVLAPHNALALSATLDDLDATLATVRHHLRERGVLLFDVLNPRREEESAMEDAEEGWQPLEGIEPPRPVFAPHLRERSRGPRGTTQGIRRLRVRHFTVQEIDQALRDGGFEASERFGGFDRRTFSATDPIQVVIAHRSED